MAQLFLLGRIIFGGYFLYNGMNHFVSMAAMVQYAGSKGVPLPEIAVTVAGALLIVGGVSIVLGLWPPLGILCIVIFLAGVTPMMHNFWAMTDAGARLGEIVNFTKNIALLGGALGLLGVPQPWPYSVERRPRMIAV
jgi:putative oxidoreductase